MAINPALAAQFQAMLRQRAEQENRLLLDIKAGRMTLKPDGITVTADPRRGRLQLTRGEEGFLQLKWVLRPGGQVELDRMILPGRAVMETVPECKDGRVWLCRMDGNKFFFWLQEPKTDKDEEWLENVNKLFREGPQEAEEGDGLAAELGLDSGLLQSLGQAMDPEAQLRMALEQSRREALQAQQQQQPSEASSSSSSASSSQQPSAESSSAAAGSAPSSGDVSPDQARAFMEQLRSFAMMQQAAQQQVDSLRLTDVLNSDRLLPVLDDEMIGRLAEHLPQNQQTPEALRSQIRGPQFRQALNHLQQVCSGPEYHQILVSLGLPLDSDMGVEGFLRALQKHVDKDKPESQSNQEDEDDDKMKDD